MTEAIAPAALRTRGRDQAQHGVPPLTRCRTAGIGTADPPGSKHERKNGSRPQLGRVARRLLLPRKGATPGASPAWLVLVRSSRQAEVAGIGVIQQRTVVAPRALRAVARALLSFRDEHQAVTSTSPVCTERTTGRRSPSTT